jgi:uncharacterized protein (DUF1499 family)
MTEQDKPPGLIKWVGYLAITLLVILPISVMTVRSGGWQQGLMLYAIACFGSALLVLLSIVLLLLPRFSNWRKGISQRAIIALPGTVLLLSLLSVGSSPTIHDITTDTQDPPTFVMAVEQRGTDTNPLDVDQEVIAQQQAAYPDIQTLTIALPADPTFDLALQVAEELGWEVYNEDRNAGLIEAVDTTAVMQFKDDIVIRVRTSAEGTLLDLRSVSRVGLGDMGTNAKRIRAFTEAFQQQG